MFRITRLVHLTNITTKIVTRPSPIAPNRLCLQHAITIQKRLYAKDPNDKGAPGSGDKKVPYDPRDKACKTPAKEKPKLKLKECKPIDIHPCIPPPPPINPELPHLDDCKKLENLSPCPKPKELPKPECPHDEEGWDTYKNAAWIGLLLAAATLGSLYLLGFFDPKKDDSKKKKKRLPVKDPKKVKEIPKDVPYLLIGGGTASFSAFRAIKSSDPTAKVLVITNESFHPYMRPPLSKEMWFNEDPESVEKLIFKQWNGSERNLFYEPEDFYIRCRALDKSENGGVSVARGYTVDRIDVNERIAYLTEEDYEIHYDKCLIATGSTPKTLSVFDVATKDAVVQQKVHLFRNIEDFENIYDVFDESAAIAVIGGGFLGSELACALARKAKKSVEKHKASGGSGGPKKRTMVYQLFREKGNMAKILPEYLSDWTTSKVNAEGVSVLGNTEVVGVKYDNDTDKLVLVLSTGITLQVDHAIIAVGVEPSTEMAQKSDLEVDPELGGYLVNTELMARSNLYIAGDCACFYDAKFGRRRIEHHDHAVVTGRLAGENMTGQTKPYLHQSMFWSDLGPDVGYEAIGIVDASLPTVGVFAKGSDKSVHTQSDEGSKAASTGDKPDKKDWDDYGKGVVFYLRDDVVVGIVLWNVFNRMSIARQVLKDGSHYEDLNEVAKLFNIHDDQ